MPVVTTPAGVILACLQGNALADTQVEDCLDLSGWVGMSSSVRPELSPHHGAFQAACADPLKHLGRAPRQVAAAVAGVSERFGPDCSIMPERSSSPFLETTLEEWNRLFAINVKSMFLMTRAVLPQNDQRRRRIDRLHLVDLCCCRDSDGSAL